MSSDTWQYERDMLRLGLFAEDPYGQSEKHEDGRVYRFMLAPEDDAWLRDVWLECQFVPLPTAHPQLFAFALRKSWYGGMGSWTIGTLQDIVDAIDARLLEFACVCPAYAGWNT